MPQFVVKLVRVQGPFWGSFDSAFDFCNVCADVLWNVIRLIIKKGDYYA